MNTKKEGKLRRGTARKFVGRESGVWERKVGAQVLCCSGRLLNVAMK